MQRTIKNLFKLSGFLITLILVGLFKCNYSMEPHVEELSEVVIHNEPISQLPILNDRNKDSLIKEIYYRLIEEARSFEDIYSSSHQQAITNLLVDSTSHHEALQLLGTVLSTVESKEEIKNLETAIKKVDPLYVLALCIKSSKKLVSLLHEVLGVQELMSNITNQEQRRILLAGTIENCHDKDNIKECYILLSQLLLHYEHYLHIIPSRATRAVFAFDGHSVRQLTICGALALLALTAFSKATGELCQSRTISTSNLVLFLVALVPLILSWEIYSKESMQRFNEKRRQTKLLLSYLTIRLKYNIRLLKNKLEQLQAESIQEQAVVSTN